MLLGGLLYDIESRCSTAPERVSQRAVLGNRRGTDTSGHLGASIIIVLVIMSFASFSTSLST